MNTRLPAVLSRDTRGNLQLNFDSILEPERLFKICQGHGLAVFGYGTDLQKDHSVNFSKDVDETHLMMILRDRYDLRLRNTSA